MAVSLKPVLGVSLTVAVAGTAQSPGTAVPDNCHTIGVRNTSATDMYMAFVAVAGDFSTPAAVVIPSDAYREYSIDVLSERAISSTDLLFFDAAVGGSIVQVTFICGRKT